MKIFIAGICGTFMAGIAQIARAMGADVFGCDQNVYPPMSTVLNHLGIDVLSGYDPAHIPQDSDVVIIGNALSRGNALVEHVLSRRIPYTSGPQWLGQQLLRKRPVIAVAGTHGKTSTASMVAWILESAGLAPGFLIGGKPGNFDDTARIGDGDWFVIEADEYDTAFFDKRSKFVHYSSDVAILNNLEFDHADIFDDLDDIKRQFHHLVRTVPGDGTIVFNADDANIDSVLKMGCWSETQAISLNAPSDSWYAEPTNPEASGFQIWRAGEVAGTVEWSCFGHHNMHNALAAIAAATIAGVTVVDACRALESFVPSARRLQRRFANDEYILYEDFAHHPTAIRLTLESLRNAHPDHQLLALIEPRSNTMQMGVHEELMGEAVAPAHEVIFYIPREISWRPKNLGMQSRITSVSDPARVVEEVTNRQHPTVIVAMSNGSFDGLPDLIQDALTTAV